MAESACRVFISYSRDDEAHIQRVLKLSERLRADGVDTVLDQYLQGSPEEGLPRWMLNQLDEADHVLVVCTETYYRRFRGHEQPGMGKGVDWEGGLITQQMYDARSRTRKFVPVLFGLTDERWIPEPLRGQIFYVIDERGYRQLYDALRGQAGVEPRPLGKLRHEAQRRAKSATFDEARTVSQLGESQVAANIVLFEDAVGVLKEHQRKQRKGVKVLWLVGSLVMAIAVAVVYAVYDLDARRARYLAASGLVFLYGAHLLVRHEWFSLFDDKWEGVSFYLIFGNALIMAASAYWIAVYFHSADALLLGVIPPPIVYYWIHVWAGVSSFDHATFTRAKRAGRDFLDRDRWPSQ